MLEPEHILTIIEAHEVECNMNDVPGTEALFYQNFGLYEAYAKLLDSVGMDYLKPPFK